MRFRVTSVAGSLEGNRLNGVTVGFEDQLNVALGSTDFGSSIDQFTIVVVSVDDDATENEKFAKAHRRLATAKIPFTEASLRYLSVAVPIAPLLLAGQKDRQLPQFVSSRISAVLANRPSRVPKGLDYSHLATSVDATLRVGVS